MVTAPHSGSSPAQAALTPRIGTRAESDEHLREIIQHKIAELRARTDIKPESEKQRLIDALNGILSSGNLSAASVYKALEQATSEATQEAAETVVDSIMSYELMRDYGLNEGEVRRVRSLSKRVDVHNRKSVEAFADAMVDPSLPEPQRKQLIQDTADHIAKHPEIVKAHNDASPEARTEAAAAYVKTQKSLKELIQDKRYAASKDLLELADHLGLEADPKVQESVRQLQQGTMDQEKFAAAVGPEIVAQKGKIIAEIHAARETVLARHPEKAPHLNAVEAHEIAVIAMDVFKQRKQNPNYTMTPKEGAAMEVFMLSKQTVVLKMLGDNALSIDKHISFERDAGTLEQRTERAMAMLQQNMPPELSGIPPKRLEAIIKNSLIEADQRNISVANLDTLSGNDLYDFSASVTAQMMKKQEDFRAAERESEKKGLAVAEKALAEVAENMRKAGVTNGEPLTPTEAAADKAAVITTAKSPEELAGGTRLG